MHTPVFLDEVITALEVKNGDMYIDATAGEGGHTEKIAEMGGRVLSLDWDEEQINNLKSYSSNNNITFVQSNFADIEKVSIEQNFYPVDGVLFDFGLSWRQLADSGRGFSFQKPQDELDMRIDLTEEKSAKAIINTGSLEELYNIFACYSEEFHSRAIAETIFYTRRQRRINTVADLIRVIDKALKGCTVKHSHNKTPVYARIFQALRIAVNHEFENIEKGLEGAVKLLKPGGKLVVITFHSLEDRIVKAYGKKHDDVLENVKDKDLIKRPLRSFEKSALLRVFIKK